MKKIFLIFFFSFLFLTCINNVDAYEYYDLDTDILIVTDEFLIYMTEEELEKKYNYDHEAPMYANEQISIYVSRESNKKYDENKLKLMGDGLINKDQYVDYYIDSIKFDENIYLIGIFTYDQDYVYYFAAFSRDEKFGRDVLSSIVTNSKYNYSTLQSIARTKSNTTTTLKRAGIKKSDASAVIKVDDGKGNVTINYAESGNKLNTSILMDVIIKLVGTVAIIVGAIYLILTRDTNMKFLNYVGIVMVIDLIFKLFYTDALVVTAGSIEPLYVLAYFLSGILGLIFISRPSDKFKYIITNDNKLNINPDKFNNQEKEKETIEHLDI